MTNENARPKHSGKPRRPHGGKPHPGRGPKPGSNHRRHRDEPEEKFIRRAIPDIDTPFTRMGIDARVAINLPGLGIETPSPIQEKSIPGIVEGRDLLGLAQTGTGKTAAFGLPMLTRLLNIGRKPEPRTCRALILAPTRELATQIAEEIRVLARFTDLKLTTIFGGVPVARQARALRGRPEIIVGCP
ncbi:MAG: DEAD/DEAH box helicase, partial [Anaerolineae bacterium]|nr:DEAD/DEAH box helicase [Anaerolineae bacterium]